MLELRIDRDETRFEPGAVLRGELRWSFDRIPEEIRVRVLWYTEGRGDRDVDVAEEIAIGAPVASGSSPFRFDLPQGPYAFAGRLISVCWALEAVCDKPREITRLDFTLGPGGDEVTLDPGGVTSTAP